MSTPRAARSSFERVHDALTAADCRPRLRGTHVQARCPAHEDHAPSLGVDYRPAEGRTMVRCHAGCAIHDVLAVLGLRLADLHDAPLPERQRMAPRTTKPGKPRTARAPEHEHDFGRQPETVHPYTDATGQLLAECRRFRCACGAKTIRWRRPTAAGRWDYTQLSAEARPLYRAGEVAAAVAAGQVVHVVEGESCADALAAVGLTATCNPNGADSGSGSKWLAQHTAALAGARVVLLVDRDEAGYRHGAYVRSQLQAAGAQVLDVLGAALRHPGADVRDHLAAGLGLDELQPVDLAAVLADVAAPRRGGEASGQDAQTAEGGGDGSPAQVDPLRRRRSALSVGSQSTEAPGLEANPSAAAGGAGGGSAAPPGNVVPLHPEGDPGPHRPGPALPMSSGEWAYATGEHSWPRGVYTANRDRPWRLVAPLPYVRTRIVRRDGAGRRIATDYLLAVADDDTPGLVIGHLKLRDGSWANELGLPLSDDDKVSKATSTAIRLHAQDAPEREATPREQDGQIAVPAAECLPNGYLATSGQSRADGLAAWQPILQLAAGRPGIALALGAAAVAPFVGALHRQSHVLSLYGDSGQGKTTTLRLVAGVWGDPWSAGGVVRSWNTTGVGIARYLGSLGLLPPVLDEAGMAPWKPAEWGQRVYELCEGSSRLRAEARGPGVTSGAPWHGVLISSGNGRLTADLGAGRFAGVARRVIEVPTPLTADAEQAEALDQLLRQSWGHHGAALLETYDTAAVAELIAAAETRLGRPEDGQARTIAGHLAAHIAGAVMLDALTGTGTLLTDATTAAAVDYLAQWTPPEHDGDRALAAVHDAIASQPAMWPTRSVYLEHLLPHAAFGAPTDPSRVDLPQHGVNREVSGVRDDDGGWVALFPSAWHQLCQALDLDEAVALRELHARGVLHVTDAERRRGRWARYVRLSRPTRMYVLTMPREDDPGEPAPTDPMVTHAVPTGAPVALALVDEPVVDQALADVTDTPAGSSPSETTPNAATAVAAGLCPGCHEPVADSIRELFDGWHVLCAPEHIQPAEPPAPAAAPAPPTPREGAQEPAQAPPARPEPVSAAPDVAEAVQGAEPSAGDVAARAGSPSGATATRRSRRPWTARRTAYLSWSTGRGTTDAGSTVTVPRRAPLAGLLAGLPEDVQRVYLVGGVAGGTSGERFEAWALGEPADGWSVSPRGHYLDSEARDRAALRFTRPDGGPVEVQRITSWLDDPQLTPEQAAGAFALLNAGLAATFGEDMTALSTPATTGRELLRRSLPPRHDFELLAPEHRELLHRTSGQGRFEMFASPEHHTAAAGCGRFGDDTIPGLAAYDARWAYAGLCRGALGSGPAVLDDRSEFLGHQPARYEIEFQVPDGWNHLGLLGVWRDGAPWWPSLPDGQRHRTWVDARELLLAQRWGWELGRDVRIVGRLVLGGDRSEPLRTWADKITALRESWLPAQVDQPAAVVDLARAMVRAVLLQGIGALQGRRQKLTHALPDSRYAEIPRGAEAHQAGGMWVWQTETEAAWSTMAHPEWASAVWAAQRCRLLDSGPHAGQPNAGALHVPPAELLALRADAVYATTDPAWPDPGKVGQFRRKLAHQGPLRTPRTHHELLELTTQLRGE